MNKRLQINCAKGFAIFIVVMSHLLLSRSYTPISIAPLFGFCVPMYFYCSGYEYVLYKGSIWKEIKVKVLKLVLYTVVFFVAFALIITVILLLTTNLEPISYLDSMMIVFSGEASADAMTASGIILVRDYKDTFIAYWFVLCFVFCLLFFIIVARIFHKNKKVGLVVASLLLASSALIYCFAGDWPISLHLVPSFVSLMVIAYLIKYYRAERFLDKLSIPWQLLISLVIFVIAEIIASQIGLHKVAFGRFSEDDASFGCWCLGMITMLLCSFGFINLSYIFTKIKPLCSILSWGGINSLDILLVHMFFATMFSKFTGLSSGRMFTDPSQIMPIDQLHCFVVFGATLLLTWLFIYLKKYLLKKRALRKIKL